LPLHKNLLLAAAQEPFACSCTRTFCLLLHKNLLLAPAREPLLAPAKEPFCSPLHKNLLFAAAQVKWTPLSRPFFGRNKLRIGGV
jgi:hypothetical protein